MSTGATPEPGVLHASSPTADARPGPAVGSSDDDKLPRGNQLPCGRWASRKQCRRKSRRRRAVAAELYTKHNDAGVYFVCVGVCVCFVAPSYDLCVESGAKVCVKHATARTSKPMHHKRGGGLSTDDAFAPAYTSAEVSNRSGNLSCDIFFLFVWLRYFVFLSFIQYFVHRSAKCEAIFQTRKCIVCLEDDVTAQLSFFLQFYSFVSLSLIQYFVHRSAKFQAKSKTQMCIV